MTWKLWCLVAYVVGCLLLVAWVYYDLRGQKPGDFEDFE